MASEQEVMDGTPALVEEPFVSIRFQCGPVGEVGANGTTIERIIQVLVDRLKGFQRGQFKCRENALAITKLQEAMLWLEFRTRLRTEQGVEGANRPHTEA